MAGMKKNIKQYGLVCPKKAALSAPKAINVFGNDEESDEEDGTDWVKKALKAEGEKNRAKKQTRLNIEKALEEDPTICQYDEVFDDMKRDEELDKRKKKTEVKKAKYIDNLLKTAERRKREQEHRIERMVQKEREAEGAMYADKESFVTSAYRAKLEEFKRMEKEEENMDRLESIGDVTKQQDISGFYRHLFHQTVVSEKATADVSKTKEPDEEIVEKNEKNNADKDVSSSSENSSGDESKKKLKAASESPKNKKKRDRQYRQRVMEASESDSDHKENEVNAVKVVRVKNEETPIVENIDREPAASESKQSVEDKSPRNNPIIAKEKSVDESKVSSDITTVRKESKRDAEKIEESEREAKKQKISIWEKRTVGPVFEAALQRYYVRKAMRLSGS